MSRPKARRRMAKRSRREFEEDNRLGVGGTLAQLKGATASANDDNASRDDAESGGDWQQVEHKRSKKQKKNRAPGEGAVVGDPSIAHSAHARLQTYVGVSDLQQLVLYLLADGAAPKWCSVRNHVGIGKVVALLVPGLEAGLFDGSIAMDAVGAETGDRPDSSKIERKQDDDGGPQDASVPSFPLASRIKTTPSLSPDDFYPTKLQQDRLPAPLRPLADIFEHIWPIKSPGDSKYAKLHSPLAAMLTTPIVKGKEENGTTKGPQQPSASKNWKNKRTPITEFLASTNELVEEEFVLHPARYSDPTMALEETKKRELNHTTAADGWVDTPSIPDLASGEVPESEIEKGSILRGRKVLALDCEMCITSPVGASPAVYSLTRISLIDWDGNTVMDELVKPEEEITDYLTPYSGITASMLSGVTTTLRDIQHRLTTSILTPQTILIGHSLNSDLNALRITHPYIIDTALLFPHPRGPPLKSSLKWLAQKYLSREIQRGHGSSGHDSVEDAKACLDLVKQKCEKGKAWGTAEASGESIFKRLARHSRHTRHRAHGAEEDEPRMGAVVDWGDPSKGYGASARVTIGCENDAQVVAGVRRALAGDDDAAANDNIAGTRPVVPRGGVDFVFARLRELEAFRGWWNRSNVPAAQSLLESTTSAAAAPTSLASAVTQTVQHILSIHASLPPGTGLLLFSGSGDPRALSEMQNVQRNFKQEYRVKKWDELTVRWTDTEEQLLREACKHARLGMGCLAVKGGKSNGTASSEQNEALAASE